MAETGNSPSLTVDLEVACQAEALPTSEAVSTWLRGALRCSERTRGTRFEVSVRIVDEPEIQRLNADYRGKDTPTNVLAFPVERAIANLTATQEARPLGDLVVCAPVIAREAQEQDKRHDAHWAHILVHGMLHLLGYDHERPEEAFEMESLEARVLAAGGVANPYQSEGRV